MAYVPKLAQNPSVKPTYANMGDGLVENDPVYPPPPYMINGDHYNEIGGTAEACAGLAILARVRVTHSAGAYAKVTGRAINKNFVLGTTLTDGSVTIVKNGTGDLTFTFDAGIIPPIEDAWVSFHHTTTSQRVAEIELVNGAEVRVRVFNAGSVSDALMTLFVM